MIKLYAIGAAAAVAGLLAATWWMTFGRVSDDAYAACRTSVIAGGAGSIGGPFTLVNGSGATVTDAEVFTKPSLVYFGYTFCPDVCSLDNARNAEAIDVLTEMGIDAQGVFISIDPERDTPEIVAEYANWHHESMIGLTGSLEQVSAASKAYKTYFKKQDSDDEFYLVDHSTFTYLVLPEAGFVEFFRRGDAPDRVAERAQCFIEGV